MPVTRISSILSTVIRGQLAVALFLLSCLLIAPHPLAAQVPNSGVTGEGWPTYGGDPGASRFSSSAQITRQNLDQLHNVWTFHTHALGSYPASYGIPSFETTPILSGDTLYFSSPYDVVFALDAHTGAERWRYAPKLGELRDNGAKVTSRGVALWPLESTPNPKLPLCSRRIFIGTLDAHLLAMDASTGQPCTEFGNNGVVDLTQGVHFQNISSYSVSSAPTVVGNVLVIGSAIIDNEKVAIESGLVRGFDTITGKLIWSWEPLPWAEKQNPRTGAGNTWSTISADPALGLVYLPTGSASLDYYGVDRPGDDRDANSIVALDAATGKKVWAFQTVHHDLWDYDIAAEPVLFTWRGATPAVAVTTKMGLIFLLDRRTGQPLIPVEERPVPQSDIPGEKTSPTQPFQDIPSLAPLTMSSDESPNFQRSPADAKICREELASLRYDGIYTPPSLKGSLQYPGPIGGVHWGGAAIDPTTGILYADTNREAVATRLIPRYGIERTLHAIRPTFLWLASRRKLCLAVVLLVLIFGFYRNRSPYPGWAPLLLLAAFAVLLLWRHHNDTRERLASTSPTLFREDHYLLSSQHQSPYLLQLQAPTDGHGNLCTPTPWGAITAVNLNTLTKVWEKPLGSMIPGQQTGTLNFGGPIVTASGLVITAGAKDSFLRIFDAATGAELKQIPLPSPATSTPMTYTLDGHQYIVIAAGGHDSNFLPLGDSLMAFAIN
jgi:quinoprotein glucose dehydrogenase